MISDTTQKLLPFFFLKGIGPGALRAISQIPRFDQCSIEDLAKRVPRLAKALAIPEAWSIAQEKAEYQIREAHLQKIQIICPKDSEYPSLLRETKDSPFFLWVRGRLAQDTLGAVAVIGTREPTEHGIEITKRITKFFVDQRWSVISGLALGCDVIAHLAALDCGGHTVAVMAHGLQTVAPAKHKGIAERIVESGGALVSEFPIGMTAQPRMFVQRDSTQAGLAQGVVMIQSDLKGGSLHASRAALKYQRWLAVPYPTEKDRMHDEPKIQANLLLSSNETTEKVKLLSCTRTDLKNIRILKSRLDYGSMLSPSFDQMADQPELA